MTNRLKLYLGGLLFLSCNGVTLLTLDNQFNIFDPLRDITARGGHWLTELDLFKSPSNKYRLNIEDRKASSGFKFDSSSAQLPDAKLELQATDSKLDLSSLTSVDKSAENKVTEVWKEVRKEAKVGEIGTKVASSYDTLKIKHLTFNSDNNNLEEFHKTREKVNNWSKAKNKVKAVFALTQTQRSNLQAVYEFHDALKNQRDILKTELKKYSNLPELQALYQKSGAPSLSDIKSSLTTIDWQGGAVRIQKDNVGSRFFKHSSWGNWLKNPYRVFYDDEKNWKSDIQQSNQNAGEAYKVEQTIYRLNSTGLGRWGRFRSHIEMNTQKLNELRSQTHSHIELQVADKLLRYMNAPRS